MKASLTVQTESKLYPPPMPSWGGHLEAAVANLGKAESALLAAEAVRATLLRESAPDGDIDAADAAIRAAARAVERAKAKRDEIERNKELAEQTAAAQAGEWARLYQAQAERMTAFTLLLEQALAGRDALRRGQAELETKFNGVSAYVVYPADYLLADETVGGWRQDVERALAAYSCYAVATAALAEGNAR